MEPGCPEWEYDGHPRRQEVLLREIQALVTGLARGQIDSLGTTRDTRPSHARLFRELTPEGFPQYAGNYRGAPLRCLRFYEVVIGGDPRVGYPCGQVHAAMEQLADVVARGLGAIDAGRQLPGMGEEDRLLFVVAFAAHVLQRLLTIHPYANGNGHAARLAVWAVLLRYGYWPKRFPIEPRPVQPSYVTAIVAHRNGDPEQLESFIFRSIEGTL